MFESNTTFAPMTSLFHNNKSSTLEKESFAALYIGDDTCAQNELRFQKSPESELSSASKFIIDCSQIPFYACALPSSPA